MTNTVLEDLPPSSVLVYKTLEYEGDQLTQSEIAEQTHRSVSTVQKALYRLEDAGLVEAQTQYSDTRRTVYSTIK